jgi:hypothetical protein
MNYTNKKFLTHTEIKQNNFDQLTGPFNQRTTTLFMRIPLKSASATFQGPRLPSLVSTPHDVPCMCQTRSHTSPAPPSAVPLSGEHGLCAHKKLGHNLPKTVTDTPGLYKGSIAQTFV